jgi:hypothetical protein
VLIGVGVDTEDHLTAEVGVGRPGRIADAGH